MRCKCCDALIRYVTTRQIKVPHPTQKGHYKIVHEEEDLCRKCISISENFSNGYIEDEDFDVSSLGVDIPSISDTFDEY